MRCCAIRKWCVWQLACLRVAELYLSAPRVDGSGREMRLYEPDEVHESDSEEAQEEILVSDEDLEECTVEQAAYEEWLPEELLARVNIELMLRGESRAATLDDAAGILDAAENLEVEKERSRRCPSAGHEVEEEQEGPRWRWLMLWSGRSNVELGRLESHGWLSNYKSVRKLQQDMVGSDTGHLELLMAEAKQHTMLCLIGLVQV